MLISHAPAGYILGRTAKVQRKPMVVVLLAAMLPDFDMLWFHLVDGRSVHHHRYWTHAPGFWMMIAAVVLPVVAVRKPSWQWPAK